MKYFLYFFCFIGCSHSANTSNYRIFDFLHTKPFSLCELAINNKNYQSVDIYLDIKYDNLYPFQNLIFNIKIENQDKIILLDKNKEIELFDPIFGKAKGRRIFFSKNFNTRCIVIKNLQIKNVKSLHFSLKQLMREDKLLGIKTIDIKIIKHINNCPC